MAKTTITCSCGHDIIINLTGPSSARDSREAWLAGKLCNACASSAAANANSDLPALVGSDKQVAWAETLRAVAVAQLRKASAEIDAHRNATNSEIADAMQAAIEFEIAIRSASYWIDNRGHTRDLTWVAMRARSSQR